MTVGSGVTQCGALRSSRLRSSVDWATRPSSPVSRYLRPPWISRDGAALVPEPKSALSTIRQRTPCSQRSRKRPAPLMPAPRMTTSTSVTAPAPARASISGPERRHRLGDPAVQAVARLVGGAAGRGRGRSCGRPRSRGSANGEAKRPTAAPAQSAAPQAAASSVSVTVTGIAEDVGEHLREGRVARGAPGQARLADGEAVAQRVDVDAVVEGDAFEHRAQQRAAVVPAAQAEEAAAGARAVRRAEEVGVEERRRGSAPTRRRSRRRAGRGCRRPRPRRSARQRVSRNQS